MRRRNVVYSGRPAPAPSAAPKPPVVVQKPGAKPQPKKRFAWRRALVPAAVALLVVVVAALWLSQPPALTQAQVEALVHRAIEDMPPKPTTTDAFEKILPSVVAVRATPDDGEEGTKGMETGKQDVQRGTGVVIVESGIILTNLHVVNGMRRIHVTFSDGTDAEAEVIGQRAEQDLAVLQAKTLPDDIMPATMRSTAGLRPGDEVVAVGFPFGIGPSASAGVVSGLKRDYISPEGKRMLSNLIQFDAAVNPGNSGGPLVTLDGEVVGIVTGLLNPTEQRVFIGIGFAVPIENAASAIGLSPF
ncbi:MAG: trypsin-like peptidase domain-containing protein [Betaproteobacteria bacterium]|nr:trypsin-like peptidase domain-containing protein [Betaproteobacteria bacterium]MBV9362448.1 trypsin-like peptidase domain-containing protein [Betaproteobacteria bacterium]